jgi:hypothetical protein
MLRINYKLTGDVSNCRFDLSKSWIETYYWFYFNNNMLTGSIANWRMPYKKMKLNMSSNQLTGINAFVTQFFNDRLLMDKNYVTTINIANNAEAPTGTYQAGSILPYTGSIHNLTEAQITEVSASWTSKEKEWWLENAQVSSTDTTKRYNISLTV